ncbi:MAG: serine/threonine-protein phosphatase, partial [Planctomycetales bacterium]|nr:serine/threonine-protein phosphatase [Planctomycetales bacterium]
GEAQKGLPLGVQRGVAYQEVTIPLAPGESLLMYTDGFTDALNSEEVPYSQQRLFAQVQAAAPNLSELGRQIVAHVREFMGAQPQYDDMCMNCLGRCQEVP